MTTSPVSKKSVPEEDAVVDTKTRFNIASDRLQEKCANLGAIIDKLELAFVPVLEPEPNEAVKECEAKAEQGTCAFDDLVIQISDYLDNAMDKLNNIIQRRAV